MRLQTDAYVQDIISMLELTKIANFHRQLDKVRTFINDNSVHKIDRAFRANHGNPAAFAAGILAHATKSSSNPVHMECSTRTNLMGLILQALGYETRIVAIFNSRSDLQSHTFLEVMNPNTKRWETQDADFDIYWRARDSEDRISLADAAEGMDRIVPCGRQICGWDHVSREGIKAETLKPYLDLISITAKGKSARYSLYTSRFEPRTNFSKGSKRGKFCEVEAKRCKDGFFDITKYSTYAPGLPR
jgi:hypothetical protein